MSTRTKARIWRGPITLLPPGACPHCLREHISVTPTGRRREHLDPVTGIRCTGSAIFIGDGTHVAVDLPPVVVERDPPRDPTVCPECGVCPPGRPRNDGVPRRHRIRVDDPTEAARRRWIVATDRVRASDRPVCHRRPARVWVSLLDQTSVLL